MTSEVRGMSKRSSAKWMMTRDEESRKHEIWALVHSFSAIYDIDIYNGLSMMSLTDR